ncbi:DedA family protein [Neobacillus mesonae]|nr:DedA family protein [Neobacillus mesonae]
MNFIDVVERLFDQYGYYVLLIGLPLDFIALPIPPGNSTLTYTGYLVYLGLLEWLPAYLLALTGAVLGVTITYGIGYRFGSPLIDRFGKWLSIRPDFLEKTRRRYDKYGDKLLLFVFFVPGIRQFIGYFIGIIRLPYRTVATYAYGGTALWVTVFFSIGFVFGEQWKQVFDIIEKSLTRTFIVIGIVFVMYLLVKWAIRRIRRSQQKRE